MPATLVPGPGLAASPDAGEGLSPRRRNPDPHRRRHQVCEQDAHRRQRPPIKRLRRRRHPPAQGREECLADRPACPRSNPPSSPPTPGRPRTRPGGRLRFQPQQVQPHHPGLAPARFELQALHLFGVPGKRLQPVVRHRTNHRHSGQPDRSQAWEPHNYDGKVRRPDEDAYRPRQSKNMVSIRILQAITPATPRTTPARFGFDADKHPPYLTMALGPVRSPWQMVTAYAVFANGGYRISPT